MDVEQEVKALEVRVERLRSLLMYAPRAFVIEFTGTPKSGKSTSSEAIRHFFSRHGFRVHVLTERAAVCPIPMKGHLFFNTWCASSMLAELLAKVETDTDIIIVDRGLFDTLVWMTLQEKRGEITADEARTIEAFVLLERWRSLIDLAVVMSVSPEEAIQRENNQHITHKAGSIMTIDVLSAISDSVEESYKRYSKMFFASIPHKTTGQKVRESNVDLAGKVLDCLESFLNPEILVVPKTEIEALPLEGGGTFAKASIEKITNCLATYGRFMRREKAEVDSNYVQIIPSGVLTYQGKIFLFQRKEMDPKYRLFGKTTIWQGCHVHKQGGIGTSEIMKIALQEHISRSLFLSCVFPINHIGYCWDKNVPSSSQHLGAIYELSIDNPLTALDLRKREVRKRTGHGLIGQFDDIQEIISKKEELGLETWSQSILIFIGGRNG
jgi:predicted NUDIX family phosphoesterase/thymidylate kinase